MNHPPTHPGIQRVSNTPITPMANNLTSTRVLQTKEMTHQCTTRQNTPEELPKITRSQRIPPMPLALVPSVPVGKQSRIMKTYINKGTKMSTEATPHRSTHLDPMSLPRLHNTCLIIQEAIYNLLMDNLNNDMTNFTPIKLPPPHRANIHFEHFEMPIIHPVTGVTITSYKKADEHKRDTDDSIW
jgi:hypothetical protein